MCQGLCVKADVFVEALVCKRRQCVTLFLCKRVCVCDDDDDDDVDDDNDGDYDDDYDDRDDGDGDDDDGGDDDDYDDRDDDADADVGALLGGVTALPELSFAQNHCPALTLTFWFAREHGI